MGKEMSEADSFRILFRYVQVVGKKGCKYIYEVK